jgi:3-oxoacyl-[acyl-carrier protein] reductase
MDLGIAGRVALVTASSKGLGFGTAHALAADGARVVITGRDAASLEEARSRIADETSGEVLALTGDINDPEQPARVVAAAAERFGGLDILVPNTGGPPPARSLDVSDDQVHAAIEANLLSAVRLVRAALPHMRTGHWGRICCITSYSVVQPVPTLALSNLARVGLYAWAKTAATDLVDDGITLNLACPGPHATDRMRALQIGATGRMGDPGDFGKAVAFLCSEPAGFITGTTLVIDGGATVGL